MFSRLRLFFTTPGTGFRAPIRIFWTGLALRVAYIAIAHTYRIRLLLDHFQFGWEAGRIARALATGYGYADPFMGHSGPTTWIPPLFPLLLAGVFKVFGVYTPVSAFVILTIDSVFSAATSLAVYEIAARCYDANGHGRRVALWSAWLWALYPAAMQYGVHWIWDMALTTFLFSLTLVVALRVRAVGEPGSSRNPQTTALWAAFGLLWGLIALCNPSLMIVLPACGLWMLWGSRASVGTFLSASAKAAVAALVLAACLAPWVYRNWQVFHAFIPTRGNLGAELYQSTLLENDGFPWGPTLPLAETAPEFLHYKAIGEFAYVKEKNAAAKLAIHEHPDRILRWTIRRIYFFWASVPHPFEKTVLVEYTREINFGFLSVTGVLGLVLSIRRKVPAAWLFAAIFVIQPLIYYAVTVQARFRHPLEPAHRDLHCLPVPIRRAEQKKKADFFTSGFFLRGNGRHNFTRLGIAGQRRADGRESSADLRPQRLQRCNRRQRDQGRHKRVFNQVLAGFVGQQTHPLAPQPVTDTLGR